MTCDGNGCVDYCKLSFLSNIYKNIDKEINKIFKINLNKDFKNYFKDQCVPYFKNKVFMLKDINVIFRINNSLEIFNRILKYNKQMEINMELVLYSDTLIEISREQINFYISEINKKPKKLSKNKLN